MLAEDEREARLRALDEQATLVQALAATLSGPEPARKVQKAYADLRRRLAGAAEAGRAPEPPVAAMLGDPYLAGIAARIAQQARKRRQREKAATGG